MTREAMVVCLRVLKESKKSRVRQLQCKEQCIDHIPYYLFGIFTCTFFPTASLEIVVNEGKLPGPETLQVVGFLFCLVPFRSRPCSSTHQHVLVAARHWTSAKLPSLLHLGTNFILSQRLFFISSCLCSHFVRAETRVKIEVSFWSFNVKEAVAREYFKDFVYTELTLWKAHEV